MSDPEIPKSSSAATELPEESSQEFKYKGVRKRKWGKWVSEIRLPNSRERIWLGSYDKPEKAARAFDAAQYCLRGSHAKFNFPDSPPEIAGGHRFSAQEIQAAAAKFASDHSEERTVIRDGNRNSSATPESDREHSEPRNDAAHIGGGDSAVDWPLLDVFDTFDGGSDFGIYSGFDSIMARNEQFYNGNTLFPVRDIEEDDELLNGGEDFSHQSNFLWNFDSYWPKS